MKATLFKFPIAAALLLSTLDFQFPSALAQGSLTPPAAPAPTMKTLDQVEPRTPISTNTTPGDLDSLFKITQPGSYYFTTNLVGVINKHGIEIAASGVTVDLMGFELVGAAGALDGINASTPLINVTIRNGTVRNWPGYGVVLTLVDNNGSLERLRASGNQGLAGLRVGRDSIVTHCMATANQTGIWADTGSVISECAARQNNADGIRVQGSVVTHCAVAHNSDNGIFAQQGSTVSECTADSNIGDGIEVDSGCIVIGNNCYANGSLGNGAGIHATEVRNRIEGNNVVNNTRGIYVNNTFAGGSLLIRNSASNNPQTGSPGASNYVFAAGQTFGPTNNLVGAGGVITNQNPWANFSF